MARQEAQAEREAPAFNEEQTRQLGAVHPGARRRPASCPSGDDLRDRTATSPRAASCSGSTAPRATPSAAAAARCPRASTRPTLERRDRPRRSTRRCSPARRTCRCSATTSSRPEEKRDIIALRPETLQGRQGPGRLRPRPARPGARGPGDLPGRHGGAGLRDAVDCGEVMTVDQAPARRRRAPSRFDVDDPRLTRFDLVREGARRDGVEIVHYEPRFPVPGHQGGEAGRAHDRAAVPAHRRWPRPRSWSSTSGGRGSTSRATSCDKYYTPLLGLTLGLALLALGVRRS